MVRNCRVPLNAVHFFRNERPSVFKDCFHGVTLVYVIWYWGKLNMENAKQYGKCETYVTAAINCVAPEPEGSSPYSQEPFIDPYSEPN
jgi:hypothetical protein